MKKGLERYTNSVRTTEDFRISDTAEGLNKPDFLRPKLSLRITRNYVELSNKRLIGVVAPRDAS